MDHVLDNVGGTPSPESAPGGVHVSSQEVAASPKEVAVAEEVPVTSEEVAMPSEEVAAPNTEVAVDEVAAVSSDAAAGDDDVAISLDDVAVSSSSHEVAGDDVTVSSDDVAVSSSHEVTVSSDEVTVSSSHEVATPTDEVVVLSPEAADEVAADEVMVSLEEEVVVSSEEVVVVAVSMESSFEVVADSSAKEEEEAPIEVEAPPGSDDGFVHVELSSTQKDEAMKSLSSIIKSEEEQANTDGDWVALSSPALKVQALEETTPPPSGSSAETSVHVAPEHAESRIISYHDVKITSANPAQDVDPTKRESYLSDAEFQTLFGMTKPEFYALPKWKQSQRKLNLDLF